MTEWNSESIAQLYGLYEKFFEELQRDVVEANRSLGAQCPEMRLEKLSLADFEAIIIDPHRDREAVRFWILRIARGHEHELSGWQLAS